MAGDAVGAFDLVIFDCDGVLVDTEPIALRIVLAMLAEVGIAMSDEECRRTFVGRSAAAGLAAIEERRGAPLPARFAGEWEEALFTEFRRGVSPVTGIVAALDAISLPTCVASSGTHERMRITLGSSGLWSRFEGRLFSVTDVRRGKPFPDVFLHAAAVMGVPPARCAVVEDSAFGVTAAVAAGMTALGYAGGAPASADDLLAAGAVTFLDMTELPRLLSAHAHGPARATAAST